MREQRGFTVVELMVSALLLGLLMGLLFYSFRSGASSLKKVETQTELLQELQLLSTRLARELEASAIDSLTLPPHGQALSFLSARSQDGDFQFNDQGSPLWQNFLLYYYDSVGQTLYVQETPYATAKPNFPTTLEAFSGVPFDSLLTGGAEIAKLSSCSFALEQNICVRFRATKEKERYGRSDPEKREIQTLIRIRN